MNRILKFRAWDRTREEWVYSPDLCDFEQAYSYFCQLEDGIDIEDRLYQWTGLLDKNGKEIYEGDIVQIELDWGTPKKCNAEIIFEYGSFYGKSIRRHDIQGKGKRWLNINLAEDHNGGEIIGNIYENPELLK